MAVTADTLTVAPPPPSITVNMVVLEPYTEADLFSSDEASRPLPTI
jgi:hypothetical protein